MQVHLRHRQGHPAVSLRSRRRRVVQRRLWWSSRVRGHADRHRFLRSYRLSLRVSFRFHQDHQLLELDRGKNRFKVLGYTKTCTDTSNKIIWCSFFLFYFAHWNFKGTMPTVKCIMSNKCYSWFIFFCVNFSILMIKWDMRESYYFYFNFYRYYIFHQLSNLPGLK